VEVHHARECSLVAAALLWAVQMQYDRVFLVTGDCCHLPLHPGNRFESGEEGGEDSTEALLGALHEREQFLGR
jgi:hypothetical protein